MRELSTNKLVGYIYWSGWGSNKRLSCSMSYYDERKTYINANSIDLSKFSTFEIPVATEIPENAKLIFDKTSKFPRHKLQNTKYIRKIKESLADYLVGNYKKPSLIYSKVKYSKAFISERYILLTQDTSVTDIDVKNTLPMFAQDVFTTVPDFELMFLDKEEKLYIDYMEGKHTIPIVTDELLNKLADGYSELITPDDVNAIIQLIKTRDKDNVALAAKLFCQFNLSATPAFTRIFLMYYHSNIHYTPAGTSVVYKNLVDNFKVQYRSDSNIAKILNDNPPGKEERELIKMIILDDIVSDVEYKIRGHNNTIKNLGIKFEYKLVDE